MFAFSLETRFIGSEVELCIGSADSIQTYDNAKSNVSCLTHFDVITSTMTTTSHRTDQKMCFSSFDEEQRQATKGKIQPLTDFAAVP